MGHIARECKSKNSKKFANHNNKRETVTQPNSKNLEVTEKEAKHSNLKASRVSKALGIRKEMVNSPYILIRVNGECIKVLIDTGADVSLI